jgi:hypothetical protein
MDRSSDFASFLGSSCNLRPRDLGNTRKEVRKSLDMFRKRGATPFRRTTFSKYYDFSGSFNIPGHDHKPATIFFQALPRYGRNQADYRIDCNPSLISVDGLIATLDLLASFGLDPLYLFSQGIVTRADFALDLFGRTAEDVIARHLRARKHQVCTGLGGLVETAYCGSPRASNRTVAYTKKFKDAPEDRALALRLERRIKPGCLGCQLKNVSNPFLGIQLVKVQDLLPLIDSEEAIPEHLIDSIRLRGFKGLRSLTPRHRRRIIAAFRDPAFSLIPEVEGVWDHWPEALERSGLGRVLQGRPRPPGLAALFGDAA